MTDIPALLLRAADAADEAYLNAELGDGYEFLTLRDELRAAAKELREAVPVAWWDGECCLTRHKDLPVSHHWETIIPLYTSPPPRQPLSEIDLEVLFNISDAHRKMNYETFKEAADLIMGHPDMQEAHGIKEDI